MTAPSTSQASTPLGQYLTAAGGSFHPALTPRQGPYCPVQLLHQEVLDLLTSFPLSADAYGISIYTSEPLEPGTSVVRCPFSIAITPTFVRKSIPANLLPYPDHNDVDDDHVLMTLYLVLHLVNGSANSALSRHASEDHRLVLAHEPYVAALPKPDSLRTPLYFTSAEQALLRGTNLEGATRDRERGWKSEWEAVQDRMRGAGVEQAVVDEVSWERWLWAATMIS